MKDVEYEQSINELLDKPLDYLFSEGTIQLWLNENKIIYDSLESKKHIQSKDIRYYISKEYKFYSLFKEIIKVSKSYKNEAYFKNELLIYDRIKTNESELNIWLKNQYLDKGERQSLFNNLFMDNRELSGYSFTTNNPYLLSVNPLEFESSKKFISILERSKKVKITGTVEQVLELVQCSYYEEEIGDTIISGSDGFNKKTIILKSTDDKKHLVKFIQGKTKLLDEIEIGEKVIMYTELISEKSEYSQVSICWDLIKQ